MEISDQETECLKLAAANSGLTRISTGEWRAVKLSPSGRNVTVPDASISHERFLEMEKAGIVVRKAEWSRDADVA
jgi:hypothetical protein